MPADMSDWVEKSYAQLLGNETDPLNRFPYRYLKIPFLSPEQIDECVKLLTRKCRNGIRGLPGFFTSALISGCKQKTIVLTGNLVRMDYVGYRNNGKNIVIAGNAGNTVGVEMRSGRIIILGNAGYEIGMGMSGGEIIVTGNVGPAVGKRMSGGRIMVLGKSGNMAGADKTGGTLHILRDGI